jgi:hypothetical protein
MIGGIGERTWCIEDLIQPRRFERSISRSRPHSKSPAILAAAWRPREVSSDLPSTEQHRQQLVFRQLLLHRRHLTSIPGAQDGPKRSSTASMGAETHPVSSVPGGLTD